MKRQQIDLNISDDLKFYIMIPFYVLRQIRLDVSGFLINPCDMCFFIFCAEKDLEI